MGFLQERKRSFISGETRQAGQKKWGQVFQFITGSHQPLSQVCVAVVTLRAYFSARKSTEGFILGLPGMLTNMLTLCGRGSWDNDLLFHSIERKADAILDPHLAKEPADVRLCRRLVNGELACDIPVGVARRQQLEYLLFPGRKAEVWALLLFR